jgi:hypothetical protein
MAYLDLSVGLMNPSYRLIERANIFSEEPAGTIFRIEDSTSPEN